jgi:glycosyltransferase involved in cell wall biosynthesis
VPAIRTAAAPNPATARLPSCSAFVPVHDEEHTIVEVVEALRAVLPTVADVWEVIVVDDGSRDGTPGLVDRLARTHADVRVVRHPTNRGYGAAVRSGFAAARHAWVFLTDGDGQFDPATLRTLCAERGAADVVVGHRATRADPWHRRAYTAIWNGLLQRLLGLEVRDVNCACKVVRRDLVADLDARSTGGAISAELLLHLVRRGARVVDVPVPHHPRRAGTASGGKPGVALRAFAELAQVWWRRRP